jgi:hypothetical protein
MNGDRDEHAGGRKGEPLLADQPLQKIQPDDLEQRRAEIEQRPERADEDAGQGQAHGVLPAIVEIAVVARLPAPLRVRRQDQVVKDEQCRGHEERHRWSAPDVGVLAVAYIGFVATSPTAMSAAVPTQIRRVLARVAP